MNRTLPIFLAISLVLCLSPGARAANTLSNWDMPQQRQVAHAGLLAIGGARPVSASEARSAIGALAAQFGAGAVRVPSGPVSVASFDRLIVAALGLGDVASRVQQSARAVGLKPPSYFGSEVIARGGLGLRYNHPAADDALELYPTDPITHAEAAWSLAQALRSGQWLAGYARTLYSGFSLPRTSGIAQSALAITVSKIGMPYVWGGESDSAQGPDGIYGPQAHGGYDCSGFLWRVFKLSRLPWGGLIGGRSAAQQAGEFPRRERIPIGSLQPADVLYFGSASFGGRATGASITHAGIYLGGNWVIHSSSQGVYVLPLQGSWLGESFAWGRHL